ncbi:type II toxin-antitoxin system HigB family toxin [Microcoleus sp. N3A4]|uniref:type II toxin-antitoxin system HigB family toxin n=1 Tax=Microcoleus sp. N3A4 TaxID=3055379 RepID=UPI002FD27B94
MNDVRQISRDAEAVGNFTVFNIKGNEYRLIVGINYEEPQLFFTNISSPALNTRKTNGKMMITVDGAIYSNLLAEIAPRAIETQSAIEDLRVFTLIQFVINLVA